jgi:hypothetical protein
MFTTLQAPILEKATEYVGTITRCVLDGGSLPIFIFPQGTPYWVTISVGGVNTSEPVIYVPDYPLFRDNQAFQSVYSFQSMVDMINTAWGVAYAAFYTANVGTIPTLVAGQQPYLLFQPDTGTFDFYVPYTFYVNNISVSMNSLLYEFFNNFWVKYLGENNVNHVDYTFIVKDLLSTNTTARNTTIPPGYLLMKQEFNSLYNWFGVTTIQLRSTQLGVVGEYFPTVNTSTTVLQNSGSAGSGPSNAQILTDFQPYYAPGDAAGPRSYLYYAPGQYRYFNINKDTVRQMDLQIYVVTRDGSEYLYFVPPNQSVQAKVGFMKKGFQN